MSKDDTQREEGTPESSGSIGMAFKEWSLVCAAMAAGRSSLILRKGGIAEGRSGFEWRHDAFYLFPTHVHEQEAGLKVTPERDIFCEPGRHRLECFARLESELTLTDWATILRLKNMHPWTDDVVKERFTYGKEGSLSVALVRVFRLAEPVEFPDAPGYGGCRSWVKVPAAAVPKLAEPVLSDAAHAARKAEFLAMVNLEPSKH